MDRTALARGAKRALQGIAVKTETLRPGFWNREHHLDKMTFRELVIAYFQYPAIIAYLALAAVSIGAWIWRPAALLPTLIAIGTARARLPVHLVRHPPQHPAQPLDVEAQMDGRHLEAHPLRSPPGSEPSRGPVRRAAHDAADDRAGRDPDRLGDRRRRMAAGPARARSAPPPPRWRRACSPPASTNSSTASSTSPTSRRASASRK